MTNMQMRNLTVAFVVIVTMLATAEACFPAKYWISCLIDTCKLGGKCPGDPTAICKMEKTECNGCKARWYAKNGERANCSVRKNLKLCPGGERVVHCKVDSCKWPCSHPDFNGAACRQSYCGACGAEYLMKDTWVECPVTSTGSAGEMLPIDNILSDSCLKVPCGIEICIGQRCRAAPMAVCRPDGCNVCKAAWFRDNLPVDCNTGQSIKYNPAYEPMVTSLNVIPAWQRTCGKDVHLEPCDMKVCEGKLCRNFPNAQCRPDGCGGCKDTWYVDNNLVDCLSDACPPKVPIVRCVDDPCKYFGHYCPAAECRASQCGKCEAKFFVNGNEIDCAMPPKQCEMGVKPRDCPWYTCPANICPSNRLLMCRINPCGNKCDYDFVDINNGESILCRVFDGDGRHRDNQQRAKETTFTDVARVPHLRDLVSPDISGLGSQVIDSTHGGVFDNKQGELLGEAGIMPTGISSTIGGINVEPFFINPGPPIIDTDLLALLRSFPHEMVHIPSASIQKALKTTNTVSEKAAAHTHKLLPVEQQPFDQRITNIDIVKPQPAFVDPLLHQPSGGQSMKQFFNVDDNVISNQLLDLAAKDKSLFPELLGADPQFSSKPGLLTDMSPPLKQTKLIYPELTQLAHGSIAAGKPPHSNSHIQGSKSDKDRSKKLGVKVSHPKKPEQGVPISMHLLALWAMS